jgi:hypothetical protein
MEYFGRWWDLCLCSFLDGRRRKNMNIREIHVGLAVGSAPPSHGSQQASTEASGGWSTPRPAAGDARAGGARPARSRSLAVCRESVTRRLRETSIMFFFENTPRKQRNPTQKFGVLAIFQKIPFSSLALRSRLFVTISQT